MKTSDADITERTKTYYHYCYLKVVKGWLDQMTNDDIKSKVLEVLKQVKDPEINRDLVSLKMIKEISVSDGKVVVDVELTTPACPLKERIRQDIISALENSGIEASFTVNFTSRVRSSFASTHPRLKDVKNIIAVASNKGGVGKSLVAANVAAALSLMGAKVGLLDADVYGPNVPQLFGMEDRRAMAMQGKIEPIDIDIGGHHPLKVMSVGFLLPDKEAPVVWRAPIVNKLMREFFESVTWGELDYLIVDMPPGTGDIQLNLVQLIPHSTAVFVTTPSDVALSDVYKGIAMFQKTNTPVLGIVENMSYFVCPNCKTQHFIFSKNGAEKIKEKFGLKILGKIPLDPSLRELTDKGYPIVVKEPQREVSKILFEISRQIADAVSVLAVERESASLTGTKTFVRLPIKE